MYSLINQKYSSGGATSTYMTTEHCNNYSGIEKDACELNTCPILPCTDKRFYIQNFQNEFFLYNPYLIKLFYLVYKDFS